METMRVPNPRRRRIPPIDNNTNPMDSKTIPGTATQINDCIARYNNDKKYQQRTSRKIRMPTSLNFSLGSKLI
jgi:hypothetical protein